MTLERNLKKYFKEHNPNFIKSKPAKIQDINVKQTLENMTLDEVMKIAQKQQPSKETKQFADPMEKVVLFLQ